MTDLVKMCPFALAGVAQCCMCLWNHFGQKKMLDCSMRRNVGNFRLGCSLHISYRSTASPYSRNSRRNLAQQGRPRPKAGSAVGVGGGGVSDSYSGHFNKHLASMNKSKLSASLSSLRCLTSENMMGSGQFSGKSKRGRSVRSTDFLHKTQSTNGSSWLWTEWINSYLIAWRRVSVIIMFGLITLLK